MKHYPVETWHAASLLKTENDMNTQHVFYFILAGCIFLSPVLGIWLYYRRVIRRKNRKLFRFINGEEYWRIKWMLLMDEYKQLKQSIEKTERPAETLQETSQPDSGQPCPDTLQDKRNESLTYD